MDNYLGPILPFVDESPSFAHGFEAGRVYQALLQDEGELTFTVHGSNVELFLRMAEVCHRKIGWHEANDPVWSTVTFGPAEI